MHTAGRVEGNKEKLKEKQLIWDWQTVKFLKHKAATTQRTSFLSNILNFEQELNIINKFRVTLFKENIRHFYFTLMFLCVNTNNHKLKYFPLSHPNF